MRDPHRLRLAFLLPLSVAYVVVLFLLPDVDLGIAGGAALIASAWVVWYLTWRSLQRVRLPEGAGSWFDGASPGEQCAWVGAAFTAAILAYTALRGPEMVAADGGMAPEASAIGKHIGSLVVLWLVVMHLLRTLWLDKVEEDERDRAIVARGERWARMALTLFAIGLALALAFTPVVRLHWAVPMALANLLVMAVVGSALVEQVVVAAGYWRDRH